MLLMGGWQSGRDTPFYALWAFDPKQNAWNQITPTDADGNPLIPHAYRLSYGLG
jgi:hypothetical protein